MAKHLLTKFQRPLEREFEAWIMAGIERYFVRIGVRCETWAVSPAVEAHWPADESLAAHSKLVGLQFKQARMAGPGASRDRLKWSLSSPPGQFALVKKYKEIYYCLPTFINREYRNEALQHCLFWRPKDSISDKNAWYDNEAARTTNKKLSESPRWGLFVEQLMQCEIGKRVTSMEAVQAFHEKLAADARAHLESEEHQSSELSDGGDEIPRSENGLYLLLLDVGPKETRTAE